MNELKKNTGVLIERLLRYCKGKGLIEEVDAIVVRNGLMDLFGIDTLYNAKSNKEELDQALAKDILEESPTEILEKLLDIGADIGLIPMNTVTYRDLMDAKIMGILMPRQSEVVRKFYGIYHGKGPKEATDYLYDLSKASNYIRMDRIKKNMMWVSPTKSGYLEITINMSKPEKDPREIANQAEVKNVGYPKCLLCAENAGFQGNLNHPARQNLRMIPVKAGGENWYLQFSPYSYYEEHCILLHEHHIPMKISDLTFTRLLDFVAAFPEYFIGSNADLPIVGGSILTHEHYQAGRHEFPLDLAKIEKQYGSDKFPEATLSILDWPLSTIRVEAKSKKEVESLSIEILEIWKQYTDEELGIIAYTTGVHNTITPIARRGAGGTYIMNLILRNNRTNSAFPDGIFHAHKKHQHLKRENIGLIEAMGMAILPARLGTELTVMTQHLMGKKDQECEEMHRKWLSEIIEIFGDNLGKEEATGALKLMVAEKFSAILDNCGVFKKDEDGRAGFDRFMKAAGYEVI